MTTVTTRSPDLPPPSSSIGAWAWARKNLFDGWFNTILTCLCIYFLWRIIPPVFDHLLWSAVFDATSRADCWAKDNGACWAFIIDRIEFFTYGFYPEEQRWRANLALVLLFVALAPLLYDKFPRRGYGIIFSICYPFIAGWLLVGGLGLEPVSTDLFGGILLTLIIGLTGIVFSLPLGILLALGRYNSAMPTVQSICVVFIELIRGVPLITLLFIASTMLNYFLPPGVEFDLLLRVMIMVMLFSAAYLAEVIRGGLQAIPKGQFEAADSLGLSYWQSMRLIILPQALKISIPGIVNSFIALYKDTTLVLIIGLLDLLGTGKNALSDMTWSGLALEVYSFAAIFFFISCYAMSRYSQYLERKLSTGHARTN